jgi:hypothetical protein
VNIWFSFCGDYSIQHRGRQIFHVVNKKGRQQREDKKEKEGKEGKGKIE